MADPEQRQQSADPPQPIPPGREEPSGREKRAISGGGRPGWRYVVGVLGPGLVTGAADDDPSGIAT